MATKTVLLTSFFKISPFVNDDQHFLGGELSVNFTQTFILHDLSIPIYYIFTIIIIFSIVGTLMLQHNVLVCYFKHTISHVLYLP